MHDLLTQFHLESLPDKLATWGVRFGIALLILLIGLWLAARIANFARRALTRAKVDATLTSFLRNVCFGVIAALVIVAALEKAGVPSASLLAVLGAAGLAIGLALKDSLSNLAWGVLLVVTRPFEAGDFVEIGGMSGTVEQIGLMQTHLVTADNRVVVVPNSVVGSAAIINYNVRGTRRFEVVAGIGYECDIGAAMQAAKAVLEADSRVLKEPAPGVWVQGLGESSVNLIVRGWANCDDLFDTQTDITRKLKERFDADGVSMPFPQREIRVIDGAKVA